MKLEGGKKIETMMEEDYEYVQSEPDINRPFQGGFLVSIQIKYRSTENLQIYDPKMNHEGGSKTLNHYLRDFDELLSRMILDENENSFTIRYGIFIVNDKVHIPERYSSITNIIMVINESEITNDNIKDFFNQIRTHNHNISQGKQTQFYGSGKTILNKTDRAMIAAHTDTIETIFKNLSNETWANEKKRLTKMVLDIIRETRICTAITESDRKGPRYESDCINTNICITSMIMS
ncbi:36524_t:CDS:2, partial [Racocetra persica]